MLEWDKDNELPDDLTHTVQILFQDQCLEK